MKRLIFILSITICTVMNGAEFKEVSPLENNENKVILQAEKKEDEKVLVEEPLPQVVVSKERIEDLGLKKTGADGKVYFETEKTPYTGKFALFLGDIVEYTETYTDGVLNGPKTWYSDRGVVVLEENYKDNKIEGEQRAYYADGSIKSVVDYKNGRIIGIKCFAKDGTILHSSDLSSGTGLWKYFWENGNILEEGNYKNWKKDGVWVRYRENGEVDVTNTYKNGKLLNQVWG